MLNLEGKKFKTFLVDTNIIRAVLEKTQNIHERFYKLLEGNVIFCFSVMTIIELQKWPDELNKFIKLIDGLNYALIKDSNSIFKLEKEIYPKNLDFFKIVDFSSVLNQSSLSNDIKGYFSTEIFNELKSDLISIQTEKVEEFRNTRRQIKKAQFKKKHIPFIISDSIKIKYGIEIPVETIMEEEALSSEIIRSLLQCYKYLVRDKNVQHSDPFDLLILSSIGYMDVVMTEKSNAYTLKLIRNDFNKIKNLEIFTMTDLRN